MTVEKLKGYEPLFGVWSVESKIAEGRHSKVFKAAKVQDGQVQYQCLKTIRFPAGDEELSQVISSGLYQNVQQYLDEVELSVRNNMDKMLSLRINRNIVRFDDYTIIKESSCFYLVVLMELLTPMVEYFKAESITQNNVIDLGCDICCALEGFREAGIIHREVKPENIYVDSEGNFKLGDFGVCKGRFGEDKTVSSYIAPELYANETDDFNSDIYSLGILLYKLLNNNRLPFLPSYPAPVSIEDRETAFIRRMRGDLFPAPSNATSQLANVIYKAAAYRSFERYNEPAAFIEALEKHYIAPQSDFSVESYSPVQEPIAPVNPYHITDDTGVPLYQQSPVQYSEVTEEDKEDFAEVFSDDEEDEEEGEKVNKKWYFIIVGLVIVLALVIGLIAKSGFGGKETTTTTAAPDITFGEQTTGPATTTVPTTTETTTTATTTTATTTTATTTTATTTTATTTTETTTTATTTATTTTATTTTATTTTATTTSATTTAATTTTESTTTQPVYTEPILVYSPNTEGSKDTRGRAYREIELSVEEGFNDGNEVTVVVEGLKGSSAETDDDCVTVCTMDGHRMVKRSQAVLFIESESKTLIKLIITADDDSFSFEPDKYQYFICFEDGAVSTEDTVNLGTQIRVEE